MALGVQSVMFRTFGSVPGPLVFGAIFDSTCVYFHSECGNQANCWVYNNHLLSIRAIVLAALGLTANLLFSFLTWFLYPKQHPGAQTKPVRYIDLVDQAQTESLEDVNDPVDNTSNISGDVEELENSANEHSSL